MTMTNETIHAFEKAGLGKAPFSWVGVEIKRGPIDLGNGCTVGAPGQPMGCCAYCGQGIAECHTIRSSDGKEFTVGCVCVAKTGDRGIVDMTKRASAKIRNKARKTREAARINAAREAIKMTDVRSALAAKPHPRAEANEFFSGKTFLDYAEWMMDNAGNAGRMGIARQIEKLLK